MKILFDHCVARPLRKELPHHEIKTTHEMGWAGLKNGKLLEKAEEAGFEVLLTVDQNIRYQRYYIPAGAFRGDARSHRARDRQGELH